MAFTDTIKRWFQPLEGSASGYTNIMQDAQLARAAGGLGGGLGLVQTAENAIRLAALTMSRGSVEASEPWNMVLTRSFVYQLATDLFRCGNAVYAIDVDPAALERAGMWEIHGVRSIRYRLTLQRPDGDIVRRSPAAGVVHVRIGTTAGRPWDGLPPVDVSLLRRLEAGLMDLAAIRNKRVVSMPVPATNPDGSKGDVAAQEAEMGARFARPGTDFLGSMTHRGNMDKPVQSMDLRFDPASSAVELRRDLVGQVWDSMGVPEAMRSGSSSQAYRAAFGAWVDAWLQPMADVIGEQISAALETPVRIQLQPAKVPSVVDQAVLVKQLTAAGETLENAKRIAGLDG